MRRAAAAALLLAGWGSARAADITDVVFYDEGLRIETRDDRFAMRLEWRLQYRLTYPSDEPIRDASEVPLEPAPPHFVANRVQLRIGGHLGWAWLRYYSETDLAAPRQNEARLAMGHLNGPFDLWLGQIKVGYGRERLSSSRELQLAERSLALSFFTPDRQIGAEVRSQFAETARFGWNAGVWFGNGNFEVGTDPYPMLTARVQVHPFGVIEEPGQSDVTFREDPALTLSLGGLWTRGPYTAFASGGGTQLSGFEAGGPDRYVLGQGLLDFGFAWRGLTTQGEAHAKWVTDTEEGEQTTLVGGYAQVGWLPHGFVPAFPRLLEFVVRGAWVDPEVGAGGDALAEWTLATNAYVSGHRAKATAEVALLQGGDETGWRGRLQWDFSF